jgi:Tol biopolymer transport system component
MPQLNPKMLLAAAALATALPSFVFAQSAPLTAAQTKRGHPADHLPAHITRLTWLGERPDWRHDGKRFAFVSKVFGDVYEYELATGRIYSLSDHFLHYGFTRVQYLRNGDLLLVGPGSSFDRTSKEDRKRARHEIGLMQVLKKPFDQPPVSLGIEVDEGPAVSRKGMRIAWTHDKQDKISVGDLVYENGVPKLVNTRLVLDAAQFPQPVRMIETQSFIPPDDRVITISAYQLNQSNNTDTFRLDLETGALKNLTSSPNFYDEPEGIFPDGKFTTVEHGSSLKSPWPLIDIYKLALDGSGKLQRLTHFNDFPGWKASQSGVSDDGQKMLFQIGKAGDEAGQGYGVFMLDLTKVPVEP